jgi:hypothetical protein
VPGVCVGGHYQLGLTISVLASTYVRRLSDVLAWGRLGQAQAKEQGESARAKARRKRAGMEQSKEACDGRIRKGSMAWYGGSPFSLGEMIGGLSWL